MILKSSSKRSLRQIRCGNQQRCLHFRLLLEDLFEQLSGIVKNVDRHGKTALFLIMTDSCLRIIQEKTKAVRRRKSVNNATISYIKGSLQPVKNQIDSDKGNLCADT